MRHRLDQDLYKVLGVSSTASLKEIKSAYRRLARMHHPDMNADPDAGERMKEINAAYAILGDPVRRGEYDLYSLFKVSQTAPKPAGTSTARSYSTYTSPPPPRGQASQNTDGDYSRRHSQPAPGSSSGVSSARTSSSQGQASRRTTTGSASHRSHTEYRQQYNRQPPPSQNTPGGNTATRQRYAHSPRSARPVRRVPANFREYLTFKWQEFQAKPANFRWLVIWGILLASLIFLNTMQSCQTSAIQTATPFRSDLVEPSVRPRFVPGGATPRLDQDIRNQLKIGDLRLRVISEALAEYDLVTLSGLSDEARVFGRGAVSRPLLSKPKVIELSASRIT